jgi:signal transduction histidine kinase
MINLIKNAIKFTSQGEIIVSYWFDINCGMLRCEVKDSGIGIDKEDLQLLFKNYGRIDHQ